jgi:hypothetical protein
VPAASKFSNGAAIIVNDLTKEPTKGLMHVLVGAWPSAMQVQQHSCAAAATVVAVAATAVAATSACYCPLDMLFGLCLATS